MELAQRKMQFMLGILMALLPVLLWIFAPVVVVTRIRAYLRVNSYEWMEYALIPAVISEVVAMYFFERAHQRPRDGLVVLSRIGVVVARFGIAVFWFCWS